MVLTRATQLPGTDSTLGTTDDIREHRYGYVARCGDGAGYAPQVTMTGAGAYIGLVMRQTQRRAAT